MPQILQDLFTSSDFQKILCIDIDAFYNEYLHDDDFRCD